MMADEKKRDDFTVEMGGMGPDRGREPPLKPYVPPTAAPSWVNHPLVPVLSYCGSSIMMTALNKYVLSGTGYNLNLLLLLVQVCHNDPIAQLGCVLM
jgi:GDP-mannose transporter